MLEADLLKIQDFTKKLSRHHELEAADEAVDHFFKPMSREDFMRNIEVAEQETVDGKCNNAEAVFNGLERRYGV